jgi:hypothetical protein
MLLVTFLLVTTAMMPAPGHGIVCCSATLRVTYYSNAAHTTIVGNCIYNEACAGSDFCTGSRSAYSTSSSTCCPRCSE